MRFGIIMVDFDLETFVNAPSIEKLEKCRKKRFDKPLRLIIKFRLRRKQLKREIKSAVIQRLVEIKVLVLPEESRKRL